MGLMDCELMIDRGSDQSWKALNDTAPMNERPLVLRIGCLNGCPDLSDVDGALSANGV
jgi:hypothetical protein